MLIEKARWQKIVDLERLIARTKNQIADTTIIASAVRDYNYELDTMLLSADNIVDVHTRQLKVLKFRLAALQFKLKQVTSQEY